MALPNIVLLAGSMTENKTSLLTIFLQTSHHVYEDTMIFSKKHMFNTDNFDKDIFYYVQLFCLNTHYKDEPVYQIKLQYLTCLELLIFTAVLFVYSQGVLVPYRLNDCYTEDIKH